MRQQIGDDLDGPRVESRIYTPLALYYKLASPLLPDLSWRTSWAGSAVVPTP